MAVLHILNFISSMPRRLSSKDIAEDLRTTKKEFTEGVLPFFETFSEYYSKNGFKSPLALGLVESFNRNFHGDRIRSGKTPIPTMYQCLKNAQKNFDYVVKEQDNLLEQDILQDGLTAKKSILIRAGAQIGMLGRYALDLATVILDAETRALDPNTTQDTKPIAKKQNDIVSMMPGFAGMLEVYGMDPQEFKKNLMDLPDVVLNSQTAAALAGVYREEKLDPLSSAQVARFDSNPIYRLRLFAAEWQANRYKAYKDKKKMLELRLLNLQQVQEKTPNPAIESQIAYLQNRIDGYEAKMKRMEESVE